MRRYYIEFLFTIDTVDLLFSSFMNNFSFYTIECFLLFTFPIIQVIFIDEVDSICRCRSAKEEEHTRRIKTELLKQVCLWVAMYNIIWLTYISHKSSIYMNFYWYPQAGHDGHTYSNTDTHIFFLESNLRNHWQVCTDLMSSAWNFNNSTYVYMF